ncbi:hypothetical protein K474DRAFT_863962 [Panus rudis PR-1116 ss-1]|nr:hypothetical protein K474DRAFT_863962 [Panus rudis PR-1116 ss-1]
MSSPPPPSSPPSPMSAILRQMGLTRRDLQERSSEMREFLAAGSNSSAFNVPVQSNDYVASSSTNLPPSRRNARATPAAGPSSRPVSASPARPIKAEPVEASLPPRPRDTMEMVMERREREKKKTRTGDTIVLDNPSRLSFLLPSAGSAAYSQEERTVSAPDFTTPQRNAAAQVKTRFMAMPTLFRVYWHFAN